MPQLTLDTGAGAEVSIRPQHITEKAARFTAGPRPRTRWRELPMAAKDTLWGTTPKTLGKPYKRYQEASAHQVAGAAHDAEGDDGHKGGVQAVRGGQAGHGRKRHALGDQP